MKRLLIFFALLVLVYGCAGRPDTVTQVSTIDALLAGDYDGSFSTSELTRYGDFGIGTFDKLDGEMIVLGGTVYQVKADGKVYTPDNIKVPFASVSYFINDNRKDVKAPVDYKEFQSIADEMSPDKNMFTAVKAVGRFSVMRVRSVPAQDKPYLPLAEAVKNQSVFEYNNIEGTVVGYRMPEYIKGLNVGGYHLHFISKDKTTGGHILDLRMTDGTIETDKENKLFLILPERGLMDIDLKKDRTQELNKVEKQTN